MITVELAAHIMNPLFSVCSFIGCVLLKSHVLPGHYVSQIFSCIVSSKCLCNIERVSASDKGTCVPYLLILDSRKSVETQRQCELKPEFNSQLWKKSAAFLMPGRKKKATCRKKVLFFGSQSQRCHLSSREGMEESMATDAPRQLSSHRGRPRSRQQSMLVLFLFSPVPKLMGWCHQYSVVCSFNPSAREAETRESLGIDSQAVYLNQ